MQTSFQPLNEQYRAAAARHPTAQLDIISADTQVQPQSLVLSDALHKGRHLAAALKEHGLRHGDILALQVPHCIEFALCTIAAAELGVVLMPLPPSWGAKETGFALRQSRARIIITPHQWRNRECRETVVEAGLLPDLLYHVMIGDSTTSDIVSWRDLVESAPLGFVPTPAGESDPCFLIYSSGTTSDPKGILHGPISLADKVHSIIDLEARPEDAISMALWPAGTVGSIFALMRFLHGQNLVLTEDWNAAAAALAVNSQDVDFVAGTPLHLREMLDAADDLNLPLAKLRTFQCGGAPVPSTLVARSEDRGITMFRSYGATEYPCSTYGSVEDSLESRLGTDGRPTPGTTIRFVDEENGDVVSGEIGEILVRGPHRFMGYMNPDLNSAALTPDGWYRTGDIGSMTPDGYLLVTDRKKDIVIRGGENISAVEIETYLSTHPAVAEAAIIPTPHPRFGEVACAVVVLRPGCTLDIRSIDQHFAGQGLSRRKTPERLEIVDTLPRNLLGKVLKRELRQRFSQRST